MDKDKRSSHKGTSPEPLSRVLSRLLLLRLFLPIAILALLTGVATTYFVLREYRDQQRALARSVAHGIDEYLLNASQVLEEVELVAESDNSQDLQTIMQASWQAHGDFEALYLLDKDGIVTVVVPPDPQYLGIDLSQQSFFYSEESSQREEDQHRMIVSQPFASLHSGQPTVYMARPLGGGGMVVGALSLESLQEGVAASLPEAEDTNIFVVDSSGTLLAHPDQELMAQQANFGHLDIVEKGLLGSVTQTYRAGDVPVMGSAAPIVRANWVVVVQVSLTSMSAANAWIRAISLGLMLVVGLLMILHFRRQLERHVVAPLARLSQGTHALAAGDFQRGQELVTEPDAFAEVDTLAADFRHMSQEIQDRQTTLQESEEQLRSVLQSMPVMLDAFDDNWNFIVWNRECEQVTGYSAEEIVNNPGALALLHPDPAQRRQVVTDLSSETFRDREREIQCKDGTTRIVAWSSMSPDFPIPGWRAWGIGMDVTHRRQAEAEREALQAQLLQAQKMEAVGHLAGGIAHDFNNILTGILGHANLLRLKSEPDSPSYLAANTIEKAAERAADLTRQLLGFARRGKFRNVPVDVHAVIQDVIRLLSRTIDRNIAITQQLRAQPATIQGDPTQMEQTILNLAINARDAMPDGGELTFETDLVTLDEAYCRTHLGATPGRFLMISVTDTGHGIAQQHLDHIFEPFFTTKEMGQGTGMGLAMVYGIVKNHEGSIRVYSEAEQGTTFKVYLPVDEETLPPVKAKESQLMLGTGRIMLVDDEDIVREVGHEMLEGLGYEVVLATNGQEAVELYRTMGDKIDLVILDMVMPEMGGAGCFQQLQQINPDIKAVLSTGYGLNQRVQEILDLGMLGFIQKPYRLDALSLVINQALSGGRPASER